MAVYLKQGSIDIILPYIIKNTVGNKLISIKDFYIRYFYIFHSFNRFLYSIPRNFIRFCLLALRVLVTKKKILIAFHDRIFSFMLFT